MSTIINYDVMAFTVTMYDVASHTRSRHEVLSQWTVSDRPAGYAHVIVDHPKELKGAYNLYKFII